MVDGPSVTTTSLSLSKILLLSSRTFVRPMIPVVVVVVDNDVDVWSDAIVRPNVSIPADFTDFFQ